MNTIAWEPAHNPEGDRYSAYSTAWPEAWWSLGPDGDNCWSVGLTWRVGDDDQDFFDWSGFASEREARSWALSFQRDYGHYPLAAKAIEASLGS